MGSRFVVPGTPRHFVTRYIFAFRVEFFDRTFLLLVLLLLCLPSDNVQHGLQRWSLISIPDIRKQRKYLSIFSTRKYREAYLCPIIKIFALTFAFRVEFFDLAFFVTRIVIAVLAIRQCAAWPSTLITHKHSRQKKTIFRFCHKRLIIKLRSLRAQAFYLPTNGQGSHITS